MDITQRMNLFEELVRCGNEIYTWCYDAAGQLLSSNCPDEAMWSTAFDAFGCKEQLLKYGDRVHPATLGTAFGLVWKAAFERENGRLVRIWVIGPVFYQSQSAQSATEGLHAYAHIGLSRLWKQRFVEALDQVPVINHILMSRYVLMLHCCITGEKLMMSDLDSDVKIPAQATAKAGEDRDRTRVYRAEQAILQMVRNGDLNYKAALAESMSLSPGVPVRGREPLRQAKTSLIVLATLLTRAAIEGGLSPEAAYSLGDSYIQTIESARSFDELSIIAPSMYDDFVRRVHKLKSLPKRSRAIQDCCDHIEMHVDKRIRAKDLAIRAGYTEYYLTHKFKRETGVSVSAYVKRAKIQRAKVLLRSTEMTVEEIADALCFGTRNYFSQAFRGETGLTPGEYRAGRND